VTEGSQSLRLLLHAAQPVKTINSCNYAELRLRLSCFGSLATHWWWQVVVGSSVKGRCVADAVAVDLLLLCVGLDGADRGLGGQGLQMAGQSHHRSTGDPKYRNHVQLCLVLCLDHAGETIATQAASLTMEFAYLRACKDGHVGWDG
jgi:hypothetical protein